MSNRIFLWLLFVSFAVGAHAAKLESLAVEERGGKTLIIGVFDQPTSHKLFTLPNPHRLVLDFKQSRLLCATTVPPDVHTVSKIRSGYSETYLRVVFELKQAVKIESQGWKPLRGNRAEFHVAFVGKVNTLLLPQVVVKERESGLVYKKPATKGSLHAKVLNNVVMSQAKNARTLPHMTPISVKNNRSRAYRDVIVVLDPGHGGKDPGAIGKNHNFEKKVVLEIALKLKQIIDNQPGMHAVLTRKGDYYVGLRERLNIARKYNADVFISIHADAFINQESSGASVFALSPMGATSEAARWLAEKENHSELGGVNLADLHDTNGIVRTVLIDLSQTATIGASLQMGTQVLHRIDRITNLHKNKVEQARFVVLKSPDIPSILIETGYITNPREERNLTSPAYQTQLTQAIFQGLKQYFVNSPPMGSHLETMRYAHPKASRRSS